MRPALRSLLTVDSEELSSYSPAVPTDFGLYVRAMIGEAGGIGEKSFDILVCSPSWLESEQLTKGFRWGHGILVMRRWDPEVLQRAVGDLVSHTERGTWEEIGEVLSRYTPGSLPTTRVTSPSDCRFLHMTAISGTSVSRCASDIQAVVGDRMATRTILRSSAMLMLLFVAAHWTAGPVAAECPFIPPFPRAEPAIRSADEVIIGELVRASAGDLDLGPNQGPRKMAMRVTEVLRGPKTVGDLVDVEYLQPNWPWIRYQGDGGQAFPSCTYLSHVANVGDTIALALGAVQPRQRLEVEGVTWTQPRTTFNAMTKIRRPAQLAEIRRIAGLPETDMPREVVAASATRPDLSWLVAFAVGAVAGAVAWWRAGRRERSGARPLRT